MSENPKRIWAAVGCGQVPCYSSVGHHQEQWVTCDCERIPKTAVKYVRADIADGLLAALRTVLDQVDYTTGNCRMNDMVAAVLPREIIRIARLHIAAAEGTGT